MTEQLKNILNTLELSLIHYEDMDGLELENIAALMIKELGCEPAFLNYVPKDHKGKPYPNVLCVSINGAVLHGIPNDRIFQEGDVVKLDTGIKLPDGEFDDGAITVLIGKTDPKTGHKLGCSSASRRLVRATKLALEEGCKAAIAGNTTHDIAAAIENIAKAQDLAVIQGYGGHGIGKELHMEPHIPNQVPTTEEKPVKLTPGMRIAIEPMFSTNRGHVYVDSDGWTVRLLHGGIAAHFERTVTIS